MPKGWSLDKKEGAPPPMDMKEFAKARQAPSSSAPPLGIGEEPPIQTGLRVHLLPAALEEADQARRYMVARPAPGTPIERLLDPAYWSNVAVKLTLGSQVDVLPVDGEYDVSLRVIGKGPSWVRMRVLRAYPEGHLTVKAGAETPTTMLADELEAVWRGPHIKWAIIRVRDRKALAQGYDSRREAEQAMQPLRNLKNAS